MLFNSLEYAVFFIVVCLFYFIIPDRLKKYHLLIFSYVFYMSWNLGFSLLLMFVTLTTYIGGILLDKFDKQNTRKVALAVLLIISFGILIFFKYYAFFTSSLVAMLNSVGIDAQIPSFSLLLPIGISFFTLQATGYSIDVYRRNLPAERDFIRYALFVSFFPQIVAGPIGRATSLLKQFKEPSSFDYVRVTHGLKIMAIGFFKKMVIADTLVTQVNLVYNQVGSNDAASFAVATVLFAFQLYCDFSGYSDIAIGSAKVLGIDLINNFDRPYFSQSIAEFWRRWHISLSTWFRDYIYFPLGGNRVSKVRWSFNILIVFLVSGLWHGANWTFVLWGVLHAIYQIAGKLFAPIHNSIAHVIRLNKVPVLHAFIKGIITFALVCIAWVLFRANSIQDAIYIYSSIFANIGSLLNPSSVNAMLRTGSLELNAMVKCIQLIIALIIYDVVDMKFGFWEFIGKFKPMPRMIFYCVFIYAIFWLSGAALNEFIYAQF